MIASASIHVPNLHRLVQPDKPLFPIETKRYVRKPHMFIDPQNTLASRDIADNDRLVAGTILCSHRDTIRVRTQNNSLNAFPSWANSCQVQMTEPFQISPFPVPQIRRAGIEFSFSRLTSDASHFE